LTVYVDDRTGDAWPVREQVQKWDRLLKLHFLYGPCHRGAGCVKVVERKMGDTGVGATTTYACGSCGIIDDTVVVAVNTTYGDSPAEVRKRTICHELGHAAGKTAHNAATCMEPDVSIPNGSPNPSSKDAAVINAVYA
jgi:hypothetical protein